MSREQTTARKKNLAIRDGKECWFCGLVLPKDELTVEHLLGLADGGNSDPKNLVLACTGCNKEVGNISIAKKVEFREIKRGMLHV